MLKLSSIIALTKKPLKENMAGVFKNKLGSLAIKIKENEIMFCLIFNYKISEEFQLLFVDVDILKEKKSPTAIFTHMSSQDKIEIWRQQLINTLSVITKEDVIITKGTMKSVHYTIDYLEYADGEFGIALDRNIIIKPNANIVLNKLYNSNLKVTL
jgi:hypothetical protein